MLYLASIASSLRFTVENKLFKSVQMVHPLSLNVFTSLKGTQFFIFLFCFMVHLDSHDFLKIKKYLIILNLNVLSCTSTFVFTCMFSSKTMINLLTVLLCSFLFDRLSLPDI